MSNHDKNAAMRAELLHRVVSDFTYKADFSEAQSAQWKMVKKHFEGFRADMQELMDRVMTDRGYFGGGSFHLGYRLSLREVERWCNTAIANDFETGSPADLEKYGVEVPEYNGPSGGELVRHQVCDAISKKCFESVVWLVSVLPMGRALSVAVTRMQDVRGWLLDTVNHQYDNINL